MRVREAVRADNPVLSEFFLRIPVEAGTGFLLDRRPDFTALLRLKGESRTFLAFQGDDLAGTATALWYPARDGSLTLTVGEVVDLRVGNAARGTRAAWHLLGAVREAFQSAGVTWVSCLIGDRNRAATPLVEARAGFPRLEPRARFASVHFLAWRAPIPRSVRVRSAAPADADLLEALVKPSRFAPVRPFEWADPSGRTATWLTSASDGTTTGALTLWDDDSVRRIRVTRYRLRDLPLRLLAGLSGRAGVAVRLPAPGGVLRTWASRRFVLRHPEPRLVRALVSAALRTAVGTGRHVVQINLDQHDPLLGMLPPFPRSTYWSTLYGAPFGPSAVATPSDHAAYHVDLALV